MATFRQYAKMAPLILRAHPMPPQSGSYVIIIVSDDIAPAPFMDNDTFPTSIIVRGTAQAATSWCGAGASSLIKYRHLAYRFEYGPTVAATNMQQLQPSLYVDRATSTQSLRPELYVDME